MFSFTVIATTPDREHRFTVSEHRDELEARVAALQAEAEIASLVQTPYVVTVEKR